MARRKPRVKPTTEFGKWLDLRLRIHNKSVTEVANMLHCGHSIVCHHRSGRQRPTFSDVVAYCWVFGCKDDPEWVWKMGDIPSEEI